jgi:hypothetical protein
MPYRDPLLCITAYITVRDKPVSSTTARAPLAALIAEAGPLPDMPDSLTSDATAMGTDAFQRFYSGLEEVDLLAGLSGAAGIGDDTSLVLPSTRLGPETRQTEFALRPARNAKEQELQSPARAPPTVRKSFRRTVPAVSGVRLRRRTVLVPHVLIDEDAALDERAAGGAERTIVICVEIEHLGETLSPFKIEDVRITVGNEAEMVARVRLVGDQPFPLRLAPYEQHNLLYAVELMNAPPSDDVLGGSPDTPALSVAISVVGCPVETRSGIDIYPTASFSSSWNTMLDVSTKRSRDSLIASDTQHGLPPGIRDVLPEPPSPFPAPRAATSTAFPGQATPKLPPAPSLLGANLSLRRLSAPNASSRAPPTRPAPMRASTGPGLPTLRERDDYASRPYSPTPPSIAVAAYARTPLTTTFAPPPTPGMPPPANLSGMLPTGETDEQFISSPPPVPMTPAYPAYASSSPLPDAPRLANPVTSSLAISTTVDVPRAGAGAAPAALLPRRDDVQTENAVVVSVGLLENGEAEPSKIAPQDVFTLDVFVFNRSQWTRRLEISVPPRARRRMAGDKVDITGPGIVPLENRVRVGPLRPTTCQSVRMSFLALRPGVHSVEALVLTDIETGCAMTLR